MIKPFFEQPILNASLRSPGYPVANSSETLPRLGSRVRIPSPSPGFLGEIKMLERSFGASFCFPALGVGAGEAPGKQQEAGCGGRTAGAGRVAIPNPSRHAALLGPLDSPSLVLPVAPQRSSGRRKPRGQAPN